MHNGRKVGHLLVHGCTTHGPRAKCIPPEVEIWHASDLLNAVND